MRGRRIGIQNPETVPLEVPWQGKTTTLQYGKSAIFEVCWDHDWFDVRYGCPGCQNVNNAKAS